jgi:hypothetical protein
MFFDVYVYAVEREGYIDHSVEGAVNFASATMVQYLNKSSAILLLFILKRFQSAIFKSSRDISCSPDVL